jgi:hypothetical protein
MRASETGNSVNMPILLARRVLGRISIFGVTGVLPSRLNFARLSASWLAMSNNETFAGTST